MAVTSTTANLQAGTNTGLAISETSPGSITMTVQVGPANSEASGTALNITGSTGSQIPTLEVKGAADFEQNVTFEANKVVTFQGTTSGIQYSDISGAPSGGSGDTSEVEIFSFFISS